MPAERKLENRVILVIGGTSGIGRATAERAAEADARVVLTGRSSERADQVAREIGDPAEGRALDLRDPDAVTSFFSGLPEIDHLAIPAAALEYQPFESFDLDAARAVFDTKLWGSFHAAQSAIGRLRPGGSIVLVAGLAADRPGAGTAAVSAVNAALSGLVRALALELAPLRVNAVSPGPTDTPGWDFMEAGEREEFFRSVADSLPVGRMGDPTDSAEAILYLMSASFVTGETLHVDGGGRLV